MLNDIVIVCNRLRYLMLVSLDKPYQPNDTSRNYRINLNYNLINSNFYDVFSGDNISQASLVHPKQISYCQIDLFSLYNDLFKNLLLMMNIRQDILLVF